MLLALSLLATAWAGARPVSPPVDGNCQAPSWSPDGAKLAYEVNFLDKKAIEQHIYTPGTDRPQRVQPMNRGGSSVTAGFSGAGGENVAHELSWSPPALGLYVYSAANSNRDYDLFTSSGTPIAPAQGADGAPDWSRDGQRIIFSSARTGQGDLYLIDVRRTDLPPRQISRTATASELYPSLSPDGRSVVYVSRGESGENLYLIRDIDQPEPTRLTSWPHIQTRPTWSPDGKRIAFYTNHDDARRFDLYVMSPGSTPFPIARGVVMSEDGPSWTPDGQSIVFVRDEDARYDPVYIANLVSPDKPVLVATGTVGNTDLDVTRGTDGAVWLAVSAQGLASDKIRDWKRIYVMRLP
jgi:Tol biopolymer transport system component